MGYEDEDQVDKECSWALRYLTTGEETWNHTTTFIPLQSVLGTITAKLVNMQHTRKDQD
jgi:hypothetical protein